VPKHQDKDHPSRLGRMRRRWSNRRELRAERRKGGNSDYYEAARTAEDDMRNKGGPFTFRR